MTKKVKAQEFKVKPMSAEQQVELSILDREIEFAKEAIRPKFELVVAKNKELASARNSYNTAHAAYSEAYKEILALEAQANKIIS